MATCASSSQSQTRSTLDTSNLVDVIQCLKKCRFPNKKWFDLGLNLGLLKETLDVIEADYSTTDRRMTECLSKWLSKADDVASRGGPPTWDSLSAALCAINEIAVADKLDTEKQFCHSSQAPSLSNPVTEATLNDHAKAVTREVSTQTFNLDCKLQANNKRAMLKRIVKRNILLVGGVGTGKSTIGNQLLDKECFSVNNSPTNPTSGAKIGASEFEYDGTHYEFTVIDTNGWFDSNTAIMKNTKETIMKHVDGLHLVIFVIALRSWDPDETGIFEIIWDNFKDIDPISMLVVTFRDDYGDHREERIKKYFSHPDIQHIANRMKKGMFPVNFPDPKIVPEVLREYIEENSKADAAMLRKNVIECERKIPLEKLFKSKWSLSTLLHI